MPNELPPLLQRVFECRYERGYRYLDRCGDVMLVLEDLLTAQTGKVWMPEEMLPTGAKLKCPESDLTLNFDSNRLVLMWQPCEIASDFEGIAEAALATIVGRFDIRTIIRHGTRLIRMLGTDSIEEADALSLRYCPVKAWPLPNSDDLKSVDAEFVITQEAPDRSRGYRFSIASGHRVDAPVKADERLRTPPHLLPKDQHKALLEQERRRHQRKSNPLAGLILDTDIYLVRPATYNIHDFLSGSLELENRIVTAALK